MMKMKNQRVLIRKERRMKQEDKNDKEKDLKNEDKEGKEKKKKQKR